MFHFTTYFDKNYLSRGLVLLDSLRENCTSFELFVLCLDNFTFQYFENNAKKYPEVKFISLDEIEENDDDLKKCKQNRSTIEYYFTLSPCLPLFLLNKYHLPHICSLDADILFLNKVSSLFEYLNEYSIIITPHKFSKEIKSLEKFGFFNVSFQIFKNDETGISCLNEWKSQCINWCRDYYDEEQNFFADQKYLDSWPILYNKKLKILDDNISGIAPWNLNNCKLVYKNNVFYSNSEKLIFYHFHHFKQISNKWATNGFYLYKVKRQKVIDKLYFQYWQKLKKYAYLLDIKKDDSSRQSTNFKVIEKIIDENTVYFKLTKRKLFFFNFFWIPSIVKRLIYKIC